MKKQYSTIWNRKLFNRFICFLAMSILVSSLHLYAATLIDECPLLTSPNMGQVRYVPGEIVCYSYAEENISSNFSYTLKWKDVGDHYAVFIKALDGDPEPGNSEEDGALLNTYTKREADGYTKAYLKINQKDLENYAGQYWKISIQGFDEDSNYTYRCDNYIYVNDFETIIDEVPILTSPEMGAAQYVSGDIVYYSYAQESISSDDDYKLRWEDVSDHYAVFIKALDGDPEPGNSEEDGELLKWYSKKESDNYTKSFLTIDREDLDDYSEQYWKISIQGFDTDGNYTYRCDNYVYVTTHEKPVLSVTPGTYTKPTSFSFDYCKNAVSYHLWIYSSKGYEGDTVVTPIEGDSGCTITIPQTTGTYTAYIKATYEGFDFPFISSDEITYTVTAEELSFTKQNFNGNQYAVINGLLTWTEAKAYCEKLGGHLATITSQDEQYFIVNLILNQSDYANTYFLGATTDGIENNWHWITNEPFEYTNWQDGQPDGHEHNEDYLQMNTRRYYDNDIEFKWHDIADNNTWVDFNLSRGFICEWEGENITESSISTTFNTSTITLAEGKPFDFAGIVSTTANDGLAAVQIDIHKYGDDTVGVTYFRKSNTDEDYPLTGNTFDLSAIPSFNAGDTLIGRTGNAITLSSGTSWNVYLYARDADGNTLGGSVIKRIDIAEAELPENIHAVIECTDPEDYAGNYRDFTVYFDSFPTSAYLQFDNQHDPNQWLSDEYCSSNPTFIIDTTKIVETSDGYQYETTFIIHSEGLARNNYARKVRVAIPTVDGVKYSEPFTFYVNPIPEHPQNTIGIAYEQTLDISDDTELPAITAVIANRKVDNNNQKYYRLTVANYSYDDNASIFFYWEADSGEFQRVNDDYTVVDFIPDGENKVTVYMGDGLGYVASYTLTINK